MIVPGFFPIHTRMDQDQHEELDDGDFSRTNLVSERQHNGTARVA